MAIVEQDSTSNAALARKRRIAMRNRQRSSSSTSSSSSEDEEETTNGRNNKRPRVALEAEEEEEPMVVSSSTAADSDTVGEGIIQSISKKKPHITGIKKQSRYDPGVSMTKEELKVWRKEARRVRNRESAAASRKKNRESIDTLEIKVNGIQTKYDAALRYILDLEEKLRRTSGSPSSSSSSCSSTVLRQDLEGIQKVSPEAEEVTTQTVSPPHSPTPMDSFPLGIGPDDQTPRKEEEQRHQQQRSQWPVQVLNNPDENTPYHPFSRHHHNHPTLNSQNHIIDTMIIRPIACV